MAYSRKYKKWSSVDSALTSLVEALAKAKIFDIKGVLIRRDNTGDPAMWLDRKPQIKKLPGLPSIPLSEVAFQQIPEDILETIKKKMNESL